MPHLSKIGIVLPRVVNDVQLDELVASYLDSPDSFSQYLTVDGEANWDEFPWNVQRTVHCDELVWIRMVNILDEIDQTKRSRDTRWIFVK